MTSRTREGRTLWYHYDSEEQLVSVTKEIQYGGQTYEYERDYSGLIKEIRRPGGRYTRYQYDKIGQVIRTDYHDLGYDSFGSLIGSKADQFEKLFRITDEVGNLYEGEDWNDRIHGAGGRPEKSAIRKEQGAQYQSGRRKKKNLQVAQNTSAAG